MTTRTPVDEQRAEARSRARDILDPDRIGKLGNVGTGPYGANGIKGILDRLTDLLVSHTAELATRDAALEVAQREREEAREALAAERSAHLASVNIGLAVDDDRGDLQAALAAANERARVAEADGKRLFEAWAYEQTSAKAAVAAARAEGERAGLRRAAQIANYRSRALMTDGNVFAAGQCDLVVSACLKEREAHAAAPIPVPAGDLRREFICLKCSRAGNTQRAYGGGGQKPCATCGKGTSFIAHPPRPNGYAGGGVEAVAPDLSGAPPGETGGAADCWPLLKGMRVRWHDGSLYEFNGERNSSGGYDIVSLPDRKPAGGLSRSALFEKGARWSFVPAAAPSPTSSATPADDGKCGTCRGHGGMPIGAGPFESWRECRACDGTGHTRTGEAAAVPPTKDAP